jgi:hypothetical protein
MNRVVLALLVAVMLSLTSYLAYATFVPNDPAGTCPSTNAAVTECPAAKPSCCTEECPSAAAVETPSCCKGKANCCETKGEAGACCQQPSKAEAIIAEKKTEKKDESAPKKN